MDARSFHLLVALHVAYFPNQVSLDLSFGQTKRNFYILAHQGHFQYDTHLIHILLNFLWHQSFDLCLNGAIIWLGMALSCLASRSI